ncbi:sugar phosphate isomerase/epimerase [Paenibacillus sp. PL2-23]|uniref:sugar phosphate isomerase/epimerase family protein n=1 Tax=Paenibacillus sp. PL2-23 TaxID=2100729 RepID=UPI0030F6EAB0
MTAKAAVQLFTLREECRADFPAVLREIHQIGYTGVQFAGYHGYAPELLKEVVVECDLQVAGLHVSLHELWEDTSRLVNEARLFGTKDLIVPSLPPELRNEEGYRKVKEQLNALAKSLKQDGIRISYHNHAFEFQTLIHGQEALSYLLEPSNDNGILAELDVYWLQKGGFQPLEYMKKYAARMPILHLKDMTADEEQTFAPLGTGCIDFEPIIRWGEASGVEWYVVEQDQCRTSPLACIRTSYAHLSGLLLKLRGEC